MKNTVLKSFIIVTIITFLISCSDYNESNLTNEDLLINEFLANDNYTKSGVLETSSKEIVRNGILELTDLMKEITSNKEVITELYESINNHYYKENYITLNDLIFFKESNAYKKASIPINHQGNFKRELLNELKNNSKKYPNLNFLVKKSGNEKTLKNDSFYDLAEITFYIPYLKNDDDILINPYKSTTFVPAVIDANKGLGYKLNSNTNTYEKVLTDDDYANQQMTIIIQPIITSRPPYPDGGDNGPYGGGGNNNTGGGNTITPNQYTGNCNSLEPKAHDGYIRQVFIGHARINNKRQYDAWISFTDNGGGSEIRIGRLSSRESIGIDSLGNISANQWNNVVAVDFSRREIRKQQKKWVGSIWHKNWQCKGEIHEELFGVWEEDTEGDIVLDQTIKWKDEELFSIHGTIHNRSKDEIIRKWTREKTEFFATNLLDQGGGSWAGLNSFSDRDWAIYDVGTNFCYTMPHRWVYVDNNLAYQ